MIHSTKTISPLRQRRRDDMAMRKLNPKTQIAYVRSVKKLAQFLGRSPDQATAEDLRRFQLHVVERGVSSMTLNRTITGLRFFFEVTLRRPDALELMSPVHEPRKLPVVLLRNRQVRRQKSYKTRRKYGSLVALLTDF